MLWTLSKASYLLWSIQRGMPGRRSAGSADASVAQLVAQRIRNAWVAGSSPAGSFGYKGFLKDARRKSMHGIIDSHHMDMIFPDSIDLEVMF